MASSTVHEARLAYVARHKRVATKQRAQAGEKKVQVIDERSPKGKREGARYGLW